MGEVRRRSSGYPTTFGIRLDFTMSPGVSGLFAFDLSARAGGDDIVRREECGIGDAHYSAREGVVIATTAGVAPAATAYTWSTPPVFPSFVPSLTFFQSSVFTI